VRIVRPVVHLLQGAIVAAANWDMKLEKEASKNLDVRLKCAASEIDNLKPVPIALIIPIVS
jgi:hypothetical protein